ncbi:DUF1772 domain-containing protein [Gordonia sinesedis]
MSTTRAVILTLAVITSGLTTGLLAGFAYSVMPGLNRAGASIAVPAMQRMNAAILNPVFAVIFFGGLLFAVLSAWLLWGEPLRWWAVAAAVLYLLAVLITLGLNVPLNDKLAAAGDTPPDVAQVWTDFVQPWVRWNIVRTVLHLAAFGTLVAGLVAHRGR